MIACGAAECTMLLGLESKMEIREKEVWGCQTPPGVSALDFDANSHRGIFHPQNTTQALGKPSHGYSVVHSRTEP